MSSKAPTASPSSSWASEGAGCSGSVSGVGGRLAGAAGGASLGGTGYKSFLGVGWVVTEEGKDEDEEDSVAPQGVAEICSMMDSPMKDRIPIFESQVSALKSIRTQIHMFI